MVISSPYTIELITRGRGCWEDVMTEKDEATAFSCPPEQAKGTCEPFDDPRSHDFQGLVEFDGGRGGTRVCTRCGISSFSHAMRYAP